MRCNSAHAEQMQKWHCRHCHLEVVQTVSRLTQTNFDSHQLKW